MDLEKEGDKLLKKRRTPVTPESPRGNLGSTRAAENATLKLSLGWTYDRRTTANGRDLQASMHRGAQSV